MMKNYYLIVLLLCINLFKWNPSGQIEITQLEVERKLGLKELEDQQWEEELGTQKQKEELKC